MREVPIVESLKYGARSFLYFTASVIVGGGGIVLGVAVGYNAVTIFGTGGDPVVYDTPELIAGVVLVGLGATVLFTGLFGLGYKLVADSVTAGHKNAGSVDTSPEPVQDRQANRTAAPQTTPEHDRTTARSSTAQTPGAAATEETATTPTESGPPSTDAGNTNPDDDPKESGVTGESEKRETAAKEASTPAQTPTESVPQTESDSQVTPQADTERRQTQPDDGETQAEQRATPPEAPEDSDGDSDEWGPPGHTGEESPTESTEADTAQGGDPADQAKEQTAGEIAFGESAAGETPTRAPAGEQADTDNDVEAELFDLPEEKSKEDTPADEESARQRPEAGSLGQEETSEPEVPDEQVRQDVTNEDAGDEMADDRTGEESEHEQEMAEEEDGGERADDPLVPEYDEIPNEEREGDSETDDPLDDPLDEDS